MIGRSAGVFDPRKFWSTEAGSRVALGVPLLLFVWLAWIAPALASPMVEAGLPSCSSGS